MEIVRAVGSETELRVSSDEVSILQQALNEVLNGLDLPEFATRMGASREEVGRLLAELAAIRRGTG